MSEADIAAEAYVAATAPPLRPRTAVTLQPPAQCTMCGQPATMLFNPAINGPSAAESYYVPRCASHGITFPHDWTAGARRTAFIAGWRAAEQRVQVPV